jgi:hypothetical protein
MSLGLRCEPEGPSGRGSVQPPCQCTPNPPHTPLCPPPLPWLCRLPAPAYGAPRATFAPFPAPAAAVSCPANCAKGSTCTWHSCVGPPVCDQCRHARAAAAAACVFRAVNRVDRVVLWMRTGWGLWVPVANCSQCAPTRRSPCVIVHTLLAQAGVLRGLRVQSDHALVGTMFMAW